MEDMMADQPHKFSIPTRYNGILFRSKLEANWAEFFDWHKIKWAFEPEGFNLNGVYYLPDFWLPEIKTIFEVKGILDKKDFGKLDALWEATRPAEGAWHSPEILMVIGSAPAGEQFTIYQGFHQSLDNLSYMHPAEMCGRGVLSRCVKCGGWWFYEDAGRWNCRRCGAYDGDHFIYDTHTSIAECDICQGRKDKWWEGCDEQADEPWDPFILSDEQLTEAAAAYERTKRIGNDL
jgi:hypothetical protein